MRRPTTLSTYVRRLAAIVAVGLVFLLVLRKPNQNVVLIEPLVVPQKLADTGMAPRTVREQLLEAIRQIETFTPPQEKPDRKKKGEEGPTFIIEEVPSPAFGIPGHRFSLGAVVAGIDRIAGHEPKRVGGEIGIADCGAVCLSEKEQERFKVNLRIGERGRNRAQTVTFEDLRDVLVPHMAESVVRVTDPYHFAAYSFQNGRSEIAAQTAQEIISSEPQEARTAAAALVLLGNVLARKGDVDGAIAKYKKSTEIYTGSAAGYYNWGVALERQGKNEEAEKKYESSAQAAAHKAPVYLTWGELLEKEGKTEQALDKYREAANADRGLAKAYYRWGQLLERKGKLEQAFVKYGQMTEADPRFVGGYYATGHLLEKLYRRTEAEAAYRKEIELDPTAEISYDALAGALEKEGKDREAEEFYRYWVSVMPKSYSAYRGWSDLLRKQGKNEEAKEKREMSDKFLFEQIKP